jgi:two-component system, chemotaxis family, CheB/CheR fusion protein
LTIPVVGIGASAGGLEAGKLLLAHLPANTGLALVFVQHLDPKHHSNLVEILARTSAIPVCQAADGMAIEPDHLYVIPPDADLEIANQVLKITPRGSPHMPIDRFLRSLAHECGSRAIGMILSGAGADGAAGLEAVKAAGGVTFAQDPATAEFDSMPRTAIGRHCVDFVLPLEALAAELTKLGIAGSYLDPESFACLKELVFPRIVQGLPPHSTIRVWAPCCATGEEPISLAISLSEYLEETGTPFPVKIFASDVSQRAIEKARTGRYPESTAGGISAERLNRYFTRVEGGYLVNKALRDMCVFTRHNLFTDPPFSKLDLVSCRNGPISLRGVQDNVIPQFHYALKPNGLLLLGSSETPEFPEFPELFSLVDRERGIYARRETTRKPYPVRTAPSGNKAVDPPVDSLDIQDVRREVDRLLLSRYSPAGVVVNEDLEVVEVLGKANEVLTLPAGKASFHLLKLIPETSLFWEVEKLVHQVQRTGEPARQPRIPFEGGGHPGQVSVEVLPLHAKQKNSLLILFEREPAAAAAAAAAPFPAGPDDLKDRRIARLQRELEDARARFLAFAEDQQTSREESQNTAEEALSTNEELQSLNEELETAKEELQTVNEELITLNQELLSKNAALTEARDFAVSIIETSAAPLLILDTDLCIRAANPSFYDAFRISRQEAEGQFLYSISNGCWDIPDLRHILERVLPDHKVVRGFEIEQDFPAIGHRVLVLSIRQLDDLQQILLGIDDVTERQARADATLHESEQRFRSMADAAPVMIWVSGPDRARTFFNKGWLAFTGRTMAQEQGDGWAEGVHPLDLDQSLDVYSSAFHERCAFQLEYRLRRADGEYRWLLDHHVPRFEEGGTFVGYIGSCIDITDLKRTQEEHLAKQKLESVGTLASGIAHDFNNLLGGVLAHAELALTELAEGANPEEELQGIRAVAIRGAEIVRQLLIYAGQETDVPELVDVSRLVEEMVALLRVAVSKHATVKTTLGKDLPAVRANPAQLRQVVMNLITNASEALGDRVGVITVTTKLVTVSRQSPAPTSEGLRDGNYLQLQVSDTGRGMTPEVQAQVFDPFFTTRQAGHGLGLAVVHGVVRSLHGSIQVVSAPGRGTTFQILLPCAGQAAPAALSAPPPAKEETPLPREATILVVEDEGSLRLPLSLTLQRGGFTVLEAPDGSVGLDLIHKHKEQIDLLLLDISLPGVSSRQVLEEARQRRPGVAVIVTSAYSRQKAAASLGAPVKHFIRKPYQLNDLLNMIREVLP